MCAVCLGKGKLLGPNELLGATFHNHNCYACEGKGYHLSPTELYSIAIACTQSIKKYTTSLRKLDIQKQKFLKELVIGAEVRSLKIQNANRKTLELHDEQKEYIQAQIIHYQTIEKLVHLCMHEVQLENRIVHEAHHLAGLRDSNIKEFVDAEADSNNLKIENKSCRNYELLQAYVSEMV